jgi:methylphosphotriester-DNA--protein-cysteine methyltransferase
MKKIGIFLAIFLLLTVSFALSAEYWGSRKSNIYHYPTCKWARKIHPENLIRFGSPEEAKEAGYRPCMVCRPPAASKTDLDKYRHIYMVKTHDDPHLSTMNDLTNPHSRGLLQ